MDFSIKIEKFWAEQESYIKHQLFPNDSFNFDAFEAGIEDGDSIIEQFAIYLPFLLDRESITGQKGRIVKDVVENFRRIKHATGSDNIKKFIEKPEFEIIWKLLLFEYLKIIKEKSSAHSLSEEQDHNLYDTTIEVLKFVLSRESRFYFLQFGLNRELWIKDILSDPRKSNRIFWYYLTRVDFILHYLIDNWFLPRYDLQTVHDIIRQISKRNRLEFWTTTLREALARFLKLQFLLRYPIPVAITLFLVFLFHIEYDFNFFFPKAPPFMLERTNPFSEEMTKLGYYNAKYLILIIVETLCLIIYLAHFVLSLARELHIKKYLPRLLAAVVIGYFPLLLGDVTWKFAMKANFSNLVIIAILATTLSYFYIFKEISNIIGAKPERQKRTARIFSLAVFYAFSIGLVFLDLLNLKFLENIYNGNITNYDGHIHLFPGVFGVIDLKVLLLFVPVALLIGIFVQMIWEEKPITHPL